MRLILEKRDPLHAARRLCELAIRFASKELPYALVDERHVVLSNWDECQPEGVPDLPRHLLPSPEETLFRDVVAAYPRVAGSFHLGFDGEPVPGVFVPAANVAPLLAWLRDDMLARLDPNARRAFRDVVHVLEYAQEHGYAVLGGNGAQRQSIFSEDFRTHASAAREGTSYARDPGPAGRRVHLFQGAARTAADRQHSR